MNQNITKNNKFYTPQQVLEKLKYYCAYQERCHKEVSEKIRSYGIYGLDADNILLKLIEENYLNEERFAIAYAGGKFRVKGWGKTKIVNNLKQLHISEYCIKVALKQLEDDDYLKTINKLAQKKYEDYSKYSKLIAKQKLIKYLLSKGYEYQLVYQVVNSLF